jgi:VIT1/CCC1 family predicted Fe2+/Mn2+ transporter
MKLNASMLKGLGFGLTSGIITTLGLIIGLDSSVGSRQVIISGILIIAFADAFSDALGMHMAEESEEDKRRKEIWAATLATFVAKLVFAMTFVVPFLFLPLAMAILASIIWGLLLICSFSYYLAKKAGNRPLHVIGEHLLIAVFVIIAANLIGRAINYWFSFY